jgi:two-component system response regulator AtoC
VLVVDDDKNTRDGLQRALRHRFDVRTAESADAALAALADGAVDVMLSDVRMPGEDGISLLKRVQSRHPSVSCILITAYGSVETAVEAMKQGAFDFLTKPVNLDRLELLIDRALHTRDVEAKNQALEAQLDKKFGLESIIGSSPAMQELFDVIRQVAPTQASVLIQGPSGTGKELVANAIHRLSSRSRGPFVAVHCAALSPTLLESELFGHEKGAFTGAVSRRKGRFEQADGGTLFLDEIGEIEPAIQVKLLRVLEERRFERVGGDETIEVDIRLLTATNRDLKKLVEEGIFREDLYYRLSVVPVNLPPLSERAGDIPLLADHFIRDFAERNGRAITGITPDAVNLLCAYSWPGNVRELRNTIERMVVLSSGGRLTARDVPPQIRAAGNAPAGGGTAANNASSPSTPQPAAGSLAETEKRKILDVLAKHRGNRTRAAVELGISRRTLHRKLNEYGIPGVREA